MNSITIESNTIFTTHVLQYSKANIGGKQEHSEICKFSLDVDF